MAAIPCPAPTARESLPLDLIRPCGHSFFSQKTEIFVKYALFLTFALTLTSCGTIAGLGQDITSGAQAVQDWL